METSFARPATLSTGRPNGRHRAPATATASVHGSENSSGAESARPLRPRRNPRWIAAGLLACAVGGLGSAYLYTGAAEAHTVIRVNDTVPRGHVITQADVSVITVGRTEGATTVPGDQLDVIIGQEALTDLPGGSLLTGASVGRSSLPTGFVQVGLKLGQGRLPTSPMAAGTKVTLVAVPGEGSATKKRTTSIEAVVAGTPVMTEDGASNLVDVNVPADQAAVVAALAARDELVLVRQADR